MFVYDLVLQGIAVQSAMGLFQRLLARFGSHSATADESFEIRAKLNCCRERPVPPKNHLLVPIRI